MLEAIQAMGDVSQPGQGGLPADGVPVAALLPADVVLLAVEVLTEVGLPRLLTRGDEVPSTVSRGSAAPAFNQAVHEGFVVLEGMDALGDVVLVGGVVDGCVGQVDRDMFEDAVHLFSLSQQPCRSLLECSCPDRAGCLYLF